MIQEPSTTGIALRTALCLVETLRSPAMVILWPSGELLANGAMRDAQGASTAAALWGEAWPGIRHDLGALGAARSGELLLPLPGDHHGMMLRVTPLPGEASPEAFTAVLDENCLDCGRIDRALESKSRFLAAASHDLRQPFQAMRLFHGALMMQLTDDKLKRVAGQLGAALESGERLLNSLLDISTLEAGTVRPKIGRVDLDRLVATLSNEFRPQADDKGIKLRLRTQSLDVESDPVLLERLLRNLMSNAVRYTRHGKVLLSVRRCGRQARIQVWDTGFGIPDGELQAIFDEFHQLENPARDATKGLGLGLAIVKRLASLLGVRVEVRSELGRGSVFTVTLPLAQSEADEVEAPDVVAETPLDGVRVLVVDDDSMVLEGLALTLLEWGCDVMSASGLGEVMRVLDDCPAGPDLILTDLRLGAGESGFGVIDRVRRLYRRDIPGVVLTGEIGRESLVEGQRRGLAFLHKPLQPDKLRSRLTAVLDG